MEMSKKGILSRVVAWALTLSLAVTMSPMSASALTAGSDTDGTNAAVAGADDASSIGGAGNTNTRSGGGC